MLASFTARANRARALQTSYPASEEVLLFYAGVADWQATRSPVESPGELASLLPELVDLAESTGPAGLAETGEGLLGGDFSGLLTAHWDAPGPCERREFFTRVLLQIYASGLSEGEECPWCGHPPLVGCLTTEGDGQALHLVCGLCFRRRRAVRDRCPDCGERNARKQVTFSTEAFPNLRVRACDTCKAFLLLVDLEKDVRAIPEVDELAGLPLNLWASGAGYRRMQPNIAGI